MCPSLGQAGGIAAASTTAANPWRGQRAHSAPFGGVTPLYAVYSDGLAQSRPVQCAHWTARGRLRQQSSSLDGDWPVEYSPRRGVTPLFPALSPDIYIYGFSFCLKEILRKLSCRSFCLPPGVLLRCNTLLDRVYHLFAHVLHCVQRLPYFLRRPAAIKLW